MEGLNRSQFSAVGATLALSGRSLCSVEVAIRVPILGYSSIAPSGLGEQVTCALLRLDKDVIDLFKKEVPGLANPHQCLSAISG